MDYKLKKLYENLLLNKTTENNSSFNNNSLADAYRQVRVTEAKKQFYYYRAKPADLTNITSKEASIPVEQELEISKVCDEFGISIDKTNFIKLNDGGEDRRLERIRNTAKKTEKTQGSYFYFKSYESDLPKIPITKLIKNIGLAAGLQINQGHAGEAILGAALSVRFTSDKDIEDLDVVRGLYKILTEKQPVGFGKMFGDPKHNVESVLELGSGTTKNLLKKLCEELGEKQSLSEFKEKDPWVLDNLLDAKNLNDTLYLIQVAKEYANGKQVEEKMQEALAEKIFGTISIKSIGGGSTQSSTKVDLKISYTAGNTVTKNLLNLSLKAGKVAQFGQVSGGSLTRYKEFFESIFPNVFSNLTPPQNPNDQFEITSEDLELQKPLPSWFKSPLNSTDDDKTKKEDNFKNGPLRYLYEQIKEYITEAKDKPNFATTLYNAIKYHATLNEKDVDIEMLILNPKQNSFLTKKIADKKYQTYFQQLSFSTSLQGQLQKCKFKIQSKNTDTTYEIKIEASLDGVKYTELLGLRSNLSSFRNRVEMGPLLKELADVQKQAANNAAAKIQAVTNNNPQTTQIPSLSSSAPQTTQISSLSSSAPEIKQESFKKYWNVLFSSL